VARTRELFPVVFESGGSTKPHSAQYREFGQDWGFQKILFELADEKIEKVAEVQQQYLTDTFTFLTYLIKKGQMETVEDKWQEARRKAMKGK
jgi:hypothetical protein